MRFKPENNYKHLLKFTGSKSRPILTYFHVTTEGHLEATDSCQALRFLNASIPNNEHCYDPKILFKHETEQAYPSLDRIFKGAHTDCINSFQLDHDEIEKAVPFLKIIKKEKHVTVTVTANQLVLSTTNNLTLELKLKKTVTDFNVRLNPTYLLNMFSVALDNAPVLTCKYSSNIKPMLFTNESDSKIRQFEGIIMPIRRGS